MSATNYNAASFDFQSLPWEVGNSLSHYSSRPRFAVTNRSQTEDLPAECHCGGSVGKMKKTHFGTLCTMNRRTARSFIFYGNGVARQLQYILLLLAHYSSMRNDQAIGIYWIGFSGHFYLYKSSYSPVPFDITFLQMLLSSVALVLASCAVTLSAPSNSKSVGLVFLQGAQIQISQYSDLLSTIQKHYPGQVYVSTPSFPFDVALGPDVPVFGGKAAIELAFKELASKGLPSDSPVFMAGHSLGGVAAQQYAYEFPDKVRGLLLMGSTLLRKVNDNFTIPTLMLNGQHDGQFKPMRAAESFYKWVLSAPEPEPEVNTPVIMIPELTHMGFASYDNIPFLVRKFDLKPTVRVFSCSF